MIAYGATGDPVCAGGATDEKSAMDRFKPLLRALAHAGICAVVAGVSTGPEEAEKEEYFVEGLPIFQELMLEIFNFSVSDASSAFIGHSRGATAAIRAGLGVPDGVGCIVALAPATDSLPSGTSTLPARTSFLSLVGTHDDDPSVGPDAGQSAYLRVRTGRGLKVSASVRGATHSNLGAFLDPNLVLPYGAYFANTTADRRDEVYSFVTEHLRWLLRGNDENDVSDKIFFDKNYAIVDPALGFQKPSNIERTQFQLERVALGALRTATEALLLNPNDYPPKATNDTTGSVARFSDCITYMAKGPINGLFPIISLFPVGVPTCEEEDELIAPNNSVSVFPSSARACRVDWNLVGCAGADAVVRVRLGSSLTTWLPPHVPPSEAYLLIDLALIADAAENVLNQKLLATANGLGDLGLEYAVADWRPRLALGGIEKPSPMAYLSAPQGLPDHDSYPCALIVDDVDVRATHFGTLAVPVKALLPAVPATDTRFLWLDFADSAHPRGAALLGAVRIAML